MCITCMITWLASLVPSFFVSYLAFFFVFFVQETYTLGSLLSFDSETRIKTDLVCKLTSDKIS